jgi:hypothetical protein
MQLLLPIRRASRVRLHVLIGLKQANVNDQLRGTAFARIFNFDQLQETAFARVSDFNARPHTLGPTLVFTSEAPFQIGGARGPILRATPNMIGVWWVHGKASLSSLASL